MITIKVGGTPLYIPSDTELVLEQNNAALGDEGITANVVWTFELPAEPNQRILGAVHFLISGGNRRYECELSVDGIPFSKGELYVQSATDERRLSCGIVTNDFAIDFGDRKLKDNDYGADIVISETEDSHKQGWREFLFNSTKDYSIYKFFLFVNSKFYRDNEDYGFHANKISPLAENDREDADLTSGYVNRLFLGLSWAGWPNPVGLAIHEDAETAKRGARIFNTANNGKQNGYCFAPALRLDWLVRKVFENASLSARGTFFTSPYIKRLYSQSMHAMDGDVYQYGINTWLHVGGNITLFNSEIEKCQKFGIDSDANMHTSFGWGANVNFGFRLLLPEDELVRNYRGADRCEVEEYKGKVLDEIYALAVGTADSTLPTIRMRGAEAFTEADGTRSFWYGRMPTVEELRDRLGISSYYSMAEFDNFSNGNCRIRYVNIVDHHDTVQFYTKTGCHLVQLTRSNGKNVFFRSELGGYTEGCVAPRFKPTSSDTEPLYVRLVKCSIISAEEDITVKIKNPSGSWSEHRAELRNYGELEYITDYEVLESQAIDTTDIPLNIFSNVLRWHEHVPNLTNGEFLAKVCEAFGLSMFVNPMTREVQLDFFRDVLKGSSIDISEWVTAKERLEYAPKKYSISFSPTIGKKDVAEKNVTGEVPTKAELPPAVVRKNKHAFVENEMANRRSTQIKDQSKFRWEQAGGDNRSLEAGVADADETEEIEISIATPNMTYADEVSKEEDKYLCQIEEQGCSAMLDEDYNGEFEMVLQQYRGKRMLLPSLYIEDANPTIYRQDGTEDPNAISLSAVGKRSIGEMWLKPLYDLKGNCDHFRLTAHLPAWMFLKVITTLQPQDGSPYEQKRWIYCDGLNVMPTKISSELSGRESIICTIEGIASHVDLSGL